MQTVRFLYLAFMDFIASIFMGALIGFVVGTGFNSIRATGVFVTWKLLDSPIRFTQIVDATADEILAKSTEGRQYKWHIGDCQFNKICNWVENSEKQLYRDPEDAAFNTLTLRKNGCQQEGYVSPKYRPGNVLECVFTWRRSIEYSRVAYYAILDDGTIWSWLKEFDALGYYFPSIVASLVGSIAGIIAGLSMIYRKETNSK